MTQPKPWYSCWCRFAATQPKPSCSCWCRFSLTAQALVFLLVSICSDTAQALVFLLVSICSDTAQAFVFLLVSICSDTAQAMVFLLLSMFCDSPRQGRGRTASPAIGPAMRWAIVITTSTKATSTTGDRKRTTEQQSRHRPIQPGGQAASSLPVTCWQPGSWTAAAPWCG